jgi:hypothetical protein
MSIKLTDTQLVLLSAASQRPDQCMSLPNGPRLASAKKAAAKLLAEGLVHEVRARKDAPVWRRDEDANQAFALKLTAAGLKAIVVVPDHDGEAEPSIHGGTSAQPSGPGGEAIESNAFRETDNGKSSPRAPRAGTKDWQRGRHP